MFLKFEGIGVKRPPLIYVDAETRNIVSVNKWASVLLGKSKEELIGSNFFFWIDKTGNSYAIVEEILDSFKKKESYRGFVKGIRNEDFFWVEISSTYMPSTNEFSIVLNEPSEMDLKKLLKTS
jgi:PAS domain S-box-containing protein